MGKLFTLAAMMMVMAVTVTRMLDRPAQVQVAAATPVAPPPPTNSAPRSVTLSRGDGGHFWTDARIDGRRIQLVVDTGASHIALRASDAARLGIHPIPRDYTARVHTANGVVLAAKVQLRSVEVGGITVRDLPALVHSDEGLGVNLLGMSFLSRLRWTYERGRMVIEQ